MLFTWLCLWRVEARAHTGAMPDRGMEDWSHLPDLDPPDAWIVWGFHPSIVLGCLGFVVAYLLLAGPLRRAWNLSPEPPRPREWIQFMLGIAIVFFSLQGPLHELSDLYLFSAHMVQHLLITLVFPPLFIRGIPAWMWRPLVRHPPVAAIGRAITHPVVAFVLSTLILYFWHIPAMYDWALEDHNVHIIEHLSFMTASVIMWWPVWSKIPEIPALTPGRRMIYLFLLTIPMKGLGAIITVSDYVLYRFYAVQPRVFGLDPLADQRLGGVIMWMPGGLAIWFAIGVVFFTSFYADLMRERTGGTVRKAERESA
ncbi:MAG: cytochrome c oxidase assembly protein [Deltaproteobacteria bacterium]|nr:MAG: cytochrome c oxidase assembly protein [Deltaproteobacteria bacterium]